MIQQIHKIKHQADFQPEKEWLRLDKAALLSQIYRIQQQQEAEKLNFNQRLELISLKITRRLVPSTVKIVGFFVILMMASSTAVLARTAVPGDLLYPVKITLEKAELAFVSDPVSEAEISLKHADNRLAELAVISSDQSIDTGSRDQAVAELVRRLEKNMTAADSSLKIAKFSGNGERVTKTLNLARNISRRAEKNAKTLEQQAKDLAGVVIVDGRVIASNQKIYNQVNVNKWSGVDIKLEMARGKEVITALSEAIKLHEDLSANAVGTLLEIKGQDQSVVKQDEVDALVTDQIAVQQLKLDEVKKVLTSLDDQAVRQLIIQDSKKALFFADYTRLDATIKEAETALASATKLLSENKQDQALIKFNESRASLNKVTDVLAKIDQISVDSGISATSTASYVPAPVKMETVVSTSTGE